MSAQQHWREHTGQFVEKQPPPNSSWNFSWQRAQKLMGQATQKNRFFRRLPQRWQVLRCSMEEIWEKATSRSRE